MPRTEQTIFYFSSKEKTLFIEMGRKSRRVHFTKSKVRAKPVYIANAYSRQLVHKWSEEQAILVGTQTAIDDNPKLDVRD
jgi:diaminohydroxyphosphoribosylaminopyrimidine deaminase/5-amino-6-(5-phosphoribosylamino)uracil reductase